jgi:hypothetical protein
MDWIPILWLGLGLLFGLLVTRVVFPHTHLWGLRIRFWMRHGRKGKPVLFVYSDSSNWKDHVETRILPRIEARSVILNWSKRRQWEGDRSLEMKLFEQWAGPGEFVPTAILCPIFGEVKVFRLWPSSQNPKHGKDRLLKDAQQALFAAVDQLG